MLKIFTDFNSRTAEGVCWNLMYNNFPVETQAEKLKLTIGDVIILYQDESDFAVNARLDFQYVDTLARKTWIAIPDWSTILRK